MVDMIRNAACPMGTCSTTKPMVACSSRHAMTMRGRICLRSEENAMPIHIRTMMPIHPRICMNQPLTEPNQATGFSGK